VAYTLLPRETLDSGAVGGGIKACETKTNVDKSNLLDINLNKTPMKSKNEFSEL
jgi:hypothetical protein